MKKIKIKICNFNESDPFSYGHPIVHALKKFFVVEFSDTPDYLFSQISDPTYLKYDCIRILYTGENVHPNFNLFDYAISFDYLTFGDRHFRLPVHQMAKFYNPEDVKHAGDMDFKEPRVFTATDLQGKTEFCSFVYSNYLADNTREDFFNALSKYKKVDSGGRFNNNVGGPVKSKFDFESTHKFSIAFENSSREGYTTEKIFTSLAANTIPIYYGDPTITRVFNAGRFINCADYPTFDAVVDRVKEIDLDDNLYISIMNEPILQLDVNFAKDREQFALFLKHIVDQPIADARRIRINPARRAAMEQDERLLARYHSTLTQAKTAAARLYHPLKRFALLERMKIALFKRLINKPIHE